MTRVVFFGNFVFKIFANSKKSLLIKRDDNSLSRMILCIMKKKHTHTQRVQQACSNCYNYYSNAIIYNSFYLNKVAGHVPLYWSELATNFWNFCTIKFALLRKRTKKGIGVGLEEPVDYFFYGDNQVIEWFKKSIEKLGKCTKSVYISEISLFTKIL